ncbi:type 1 glutamine amidotransferase, partial [Paracoccaceae bacterium]|nr:type 1 glutamine amidotransferase [Paracoccaceae bacterium]
MHLLVLQHARAEHPGIFRQFLQEDGHSWDAVHLDEGEALPALEGYDGLWVMGGPMDVWQEEAYPWLIAEKAFIQEAVEEKGLPFLGLCLGHQLLAEALGGSVGKSEIPEIGV